MNVGLEVVCGAGCHRVLVGADFGGVGGDASGGGNVDELGDVVLTLLGLMAVLGGQQPYNTHSLRCRETKCGCEC